MQDLTHRIATNLRLFAHRATRFAIPSFECPICGFVGPFKDMRSRGGMRKWAKCPKCGALERHRLLWLAMQRVYASLPGKGLGVIHFAPEPFLKPLLRHRATTYETADYDAAGVDHRVDIQRLPFQNESYDLVICAHVLEHVPDDGAALREIRRILRPGGVAILPVPIVGNATVEYNAPRPEEDGHVRSPGKDYYLRYDNQFSRVEVITSDDFDARHQLHPINRDTGERRVETVPICYC